MWYVLACILTQVASQQVDVWLLYATSPYYSAVEVALVGPTTGDATTPQTIDCFEEERGRDISRRPIGRIAVPAPGESMQLHISASTKRSKYGLGIGVGVNALVFVPVAADDL